MGSNTFEEYVVEFSNEELTSVDMEVFQVNLGLRCNQACWHCHLDASPSRSEMMETAILEQILETARKAGCRRET